MGYPYFWEHPYVYVGFRFCGSSALHVESLCLDVSLIMTSPSNDPKSHWSQCECETDNRLGKSRLDLFFTVLSFCEQQKAFSAVHEEHPKSIIFSLNVVQPSNMCFFKSLPGVWSILNRHHKHLQTTSINSSWENTISEQVQYNKKTWIQLGSQRMTYRFTCARLVEISCRSGTVLAESWVETSSLNFFGEDTVLGLVEGLQ